MRAPSRPLGTGLKVERVDRSSVSAGPSTGRPRLVAQRVHAGLAALGEGHLDRVEVARHEHALAKLARASSRTSRGDVAGGEVGRARAGAPRPRAASSAAWRAVRVTASRAARSRSSSRKVASWTSRSAPCAATRRVSHGSVSPDTTTLRPAPRRPDHLAGRHAVDGLAPLEAAEVRARGHAERARPVGVELAPGRSSSPRA